MGVGVFGTGPITLALVPILREKGFEIKALWGRSTREVEEVANALKISFHTNKIDDVLLRKDVDLVFIVCQPYLHAEISVKALGIGKHVVCDRPMGLGPDAMKMVRASEYYPTLISLVKYFLRFLPAFTHMKRCLHEGLIGPLNEISLVDIRVQLGSLFPDKYDWMCDASMGGGALNLVGSHVVDLVSFLLQERAVRVHGVVKAYTKTTCNVNGIRQISAPDFCNFQMELANGTLITTSIHSHTVPAKTFSQEVLICGSHGHLVVRGGDLFIFKNKNDSPQNMKEEAVYVDVQDLHIATSDSLLPRLYIKGLCKMIGALKESFAVKESSWVKEPVQAAATFEDGLYVQAVLEAIRKSSETKSWQRIQITSDTPSNHDQIMRFARMSTM